MNNLDLCPPDLSIVIPCYNEEDNISVLIQRFCAVFGWLQEPKTELILCDNGSTDNTGSVIDYEIRKNANYYIKKVAIKINQGYGFGIFSGLTVARGSLLAFTHADLQTDLSEILNAYKIFMSGACGQKKTIIKGCRRNQKLNEKIFSNGLRYLALFITGMDLGDVNAQPKLFPKEMMAVLNNSPYDFSFDLYLLSVGKKNDYNIVEFPVALYPRKRGVSKGGSGSKLLARLPIIRQYWRYLFVMQKSLK